MEFYEYLKAQLAEMTKEEFLGIEAEGYENGINASVYTKRFPRERNPYIEINSTLLIPEKHYRKFREKTYRHRGVRPYVSYLLSRYKFHIANGLIPAYRNHTTKYQEKNQNLIKVAFRPHLDDWAELKLYRVSFGMSISAILIYLLLADFVDFAYNVSYFLEAVGIPLVPEFDLWAKVFLSRKNTYYTTVFRYRNSQYG